MEWETGKHEGERMVLGFWMSRESGGIVGFGWVERGSVCLNGGIDAF